MKKHLLFACAALIFASGCGSDTSPTAASSPSPEPSPSPTPAPPHILVSVSIKSQGGGSAVQSFRAGEEMVLNGSIEAFDDTGTIVTPPPVAAWRWSNLSDVQSNCQVFGEVNSSHPHAQCNAPGTFVVQATAQDFSGQDLGISPVFTAVVF